MNSERKRKGKEQKKRKRRKSGAILCAISHNTHRQQQEATHIIRSSSPSPPCCCLNCVLSFRHSSTLFIQTTRHTFACSFFSQSQQQLQLLNRSSMISILLLTMLFLIQPSQLTDMTGENKTIIEPLHSNVTVTSGQKAILTCIFDTTNYDLSSLSTHQLIWIRQHHASYEADSILAHNQDLLISDQRLTIQRTDIDYSLTITNAQMDDEGSYACEINSQPPQKAIIHLYVQEIPMIIDNATTSPIIINEHENVTLECQARGRPPPSIAWFRDNEILANTTNGQLHLINVTRQQTGHYECRASNGVHGHVVSKDIQLRILFPPLIRAQSTHVQGTIGKSIQLRCSATVPFDTKISWQRMDNRTLGKSRPQQQQTQGNVIQTSLTIKEIEKNDFGIYGCFAESMSGKNHAIIEFRESRRTTTTTTTATTNAQILDQNQSSTARIQILKRNKISDQTTSSTKTNRASTCFSSFYLSMIFIQIIVYNLT